MQRDRMLKYILDIEQVIAEIEELSGKFQGDFRKFENDWVSKRAIRVKNVLARLSK